MSRNVVTTELVADQPLLVVLHHDQALATALSNQLSTQSVQVEKYSITEVLQSSSILNRLEEAYKIIWVTDPDYYIFNKKELVDLSFKIDKLQQKLTTVIPIFTTFNEEVPGELLAAQAAFELQNQFILFLNTTFPGSMFLFGQDIIDYFVSYSGLQLLTQHLQKGIIYSPNIAFHPQTKESFLLRAQRYLLQPQRASVLIRGNSYLADKLAKEIKTLYQSYHFSPVELQFVVAAPTTAVPFSVIENFVTDDPQQAIESFVQSIPSPKAAHSKFGWQHIAQVNAQAHHYGQEIVPEETIQVEPQVVQEDIIYEEEPPVIAANLVKQHEPEKVESHIPETEPAEIMLEEKVEASAVSRLSSPPKEYDLNQEIHRVFSESHLSHKKTQTKRVEKKKKVVAKKTKKRTALFYGGLAFTGVGMGIISLAIVFSVTLGMFKSALLSFVSTEVLAQENQDNWDVTSLSKVERLKNVVSLQVDTYSPIVTLPAIEEAKSLVAISEQLPIVAAQNKVVDESLKTFYLQLTGVDSGDSIATAEKLTIESLSAREKLQSLESELDSIATLINEDKTAMTSTVNFSLKIKESTESVQTLQQIQPLLVEMLGGSRKRTYAVILQNNQELRPTGGFIEDVALLTFENGTLISSRVINGSQIDKQLPGSVIPPEEITTYLRESNWNFIDSNWNPDYPKTAEQVSWFIEKSLGTAVDGVISIDLYGMAEVLKMIGPLDLPEYNEVLTDKNIFDQFEFHSEVSLVDNNKDYRQVVFDTFVAKITTLPPEKAGALFLGFKKSFDKQHMLASFAAADELQSMKNLGWSGSLLQPNCPQQLQSQKCIVDVAAQVEANVGTNTANHYLKRSIDHTTELTASAAAHVRTITFENTAQSDSWPKGPYQVFLRLYTPELAELGSVLVDGKAVPADQVSVTQDNKRKIFGIFLEVPIKTTKKLTISYAVPYSIDTDTFSYTFFEQQQPGSGNTPFNLNLQTMPGYSPTLIAPQASVDSSVIKFNKNEVGHGFFGVKFEKN